MLRSLGQSGKNGSELSPDILSQTRKGAQRGGLLAGKGPLNVLSPNYSLVECYPKTGRQHQIRLHLDRAGHPIVGDKLYGLPESEALRFYERSRLSPEAESRLLLPRHALHAHRIRFDHPTTGSRMEFVSELPEDLRAFLGRQIQDSAFVSG